MVMAAAAPQTGAENASVRFCFDRDGLVRGSLTLRKPQLDDKTGVVEVRHGRGY